MYTISERYKSVTTSKKLQEILDIMEWQRMQDEIAKATDLSIMTCDIRGNRVTTESNVNGFCQAVREDERLEKMCGRCQSMGGYESFVRGEAYLYRCHMDLLNCTIPLAIGDTYLGYVLVCGMCARSRGGLEEIERIFPVESAGRDREKMQALQKYRSKVPAMSVGAFCKNVRLIEAVCAYGLRMSWRCLQPWNGSEAGQVTQREKAEESSVSPAHDDISLLFPAFDYIAVHFREKISVQYLADLCHISPSYFSRQFAKETRESVPQYILKLRVEYAKQQLTTTDKSVAEIGFDSGFGDSSHFIKSFRKMVGITPLRYRQTVK